MSLPKLLKVTSPLWSLQISNPKSELKEVVAVLLAKALDSSLGARFRQFF
jgi:hypothetical protein